MLLDKGADINAVDGMGRTALHVAAGWSNGHEASVRVLVERGADKKLKDRQGRTAFELFRRSEREKAQIDAILKTLESVV